MKQLLSVLAGATFALLILIQHYLFRIYVVLEDILRVIQ